MAIPKTLDDRHRTSYAEDPSGNTAQRVIVVAEQANSSFHEASSLSPGSSADGYDVKNTGGMFGTVTTSYDTTITNEDTSESITIYLNSDNTNPITITAGASFNVNKFGVTNITKPKTNTIAVRRTTAFLRRTTCIHLSQHPVVVLFQ